MKKIKLCLSSLTIAVALGLLPHAALAAPPAKAKPAKASAAKSVPAVNRQGDVSKGTEQMKGGDGVFGVVYTMKSGYNLQLLKARYTLEGQVDYDGTMPMPDQKVFVLTFAVKNPQTYDVSFPGLDLTLVDEDENNYTFRSGSTRLAKNSGNEPSITMKPGQGVGQDPTVNELSMALVLPAKVHIKKMLLNDSRANVASEKVMRFPIAGFPGGSPKNIIAPLPKYAADPTDPSGAVALAVSPAVLGKTYPGGYFSLRADSVTMSDTELLNGNKPADGKQWVIVAITANNAYYKKPVTTFEIGDEHTPVLKDADEEKYAPADGRRKAKRDEDDGSVELAPGEAHTFRYFFEVPKNVKLKSVTFGGGKYGHVYQLDLTGIAAP